MSPAERMATKSCRRAWRRRPRLPSSARGWSPRAGRAGLRTSAVVLGGAQRLLLRQQEVAGVAVLDVDDVAHLAEAADALEENDLHGVCSLIVCARFDVDEVEMGGVAGGGHRVAGGAAARPCSSESSQSDDQEWRGTDEQQRRRRAPRARRGARRPARHVMDDGEAQQHVGETKAPEKASRPVPAMPPAESRRPVAASRAEEVPRGNSMQREVRPGPRQLARRERDAPGKPEIEQQCRHPQRWPAPAGIR